MTVKVLRCECGFEASAERDDELVVEVRRHAWEAHGMALSYHEATVLAVRGPSRDHNRQQEER